MATSIEQTIAALLSGAKHDVDWLLGGHRRELEELDRKLLETENTLKRGLEFVAAQRRMLREAYHGGREENAPAQLPPRQVPRQVPQQPRPAQHEAGG